MAQSSELVEAYRLIKSGQRQAAGEMLKTYLSTHPKDVDAWWLMAHAVGKPENVERCLESILKIDPNHAKAREKLARMRSLGGKVVVEQQGLTPAFMQQQPIVRTSSSAPTPTPAPSPVPPPMPRPAKSEPPPFDPFAPPARTASTAPVVGDDPFAHIKADEIPDPFAELGHTQTAGTGNQPSWGPGLAFVKDGPAGTVGEIPRPRTGSKVPPVGGFEGERAASSSSSVETMIGIAVITIALLVLVGLGLWVANEKGLIDLTKAEKDSKSTAKLATLNDLQFTIDYPAGWDTQCAFESGGYRVCGIANHAFYNEVSYFSREGANIGELLAEGLAMSFGGGGEDLPETNVSIIAMDVPQTSPSYYDKSIAKTKWEGLQDGWTFYGDADSITYEATDITVDGVPARYFKYISTDRTFPNATFDVYIPQDNGMMFWMTISIYGDMDEVITVETIEEMIYSIHIKPPEDWKVEVE